VKMAMISYNNAINSEVMEVLEKCGIDSYTKWTQVQGKGKTSGPHFGNEVWPGGNSVIFTAIETKESEELLECVKGLRMKLGKAGIKAFIWDLEAVT
jgi:nitrogen regulatory protein PII